MTARDNLLAVLKHQKASWVPCVPHFYGSVNFPGLIPENLLQNTPDWLALNRFLGGTVLYELDGAERILADGISINEHQENDLTYTDIHTPLGVLHATNQRAYVPTPVYDVQPGFVTPGPIETDTRITYPVKSLQDYSTLASFYDHLQFKPCTDKVADIISQVGDDGAVSCSSGSSPLYSLIGFDAGLTQTIYDLSDEPEIVEHAMDSIFHAIMRQLEAVCDTACDIVRITEDLDINLVSLELFEKYAFPALKAYTDYVHSRGKLMVFHMCGRIRAFLPILQKAGMDAIHCLCAPDVGNTPMAEAREIFGNKTAIMSRVDANLLLRGRPEIITESVRNTVSEVNGGKDNFMYIMPCGRAPLENLRAYIQAAENTRFECVN